MGNGEPAAAGLKSGLALALLAAWSGLVLVLVIPAWEPTLHMSILTREGLRAALDSLAAPGSPEAGPLYALGHHSAQVGSTVCLHVILALAGLGGVRWLVPGFVPGWLFAWGAGFGLVSLLTLGFGLTGLFAPGPVILGSLVLAAAGLGEYAAAGKGRLRPREAVVFFRPERGWPEKALLLIAALAAGLLALLAIAPDTSWDAVVYHLRVPAFFIQEHRIFHMPTHHFTAFPLACEMLFSWLMLLGGLEFAGGGEAARLFHLSCAILAALCARRIGARVSGPIGGALAAVLVLLSPFTGAIAVRAYNDFVQAALTGIILVLALERPKGFTRLAGFLAGVAISTKYTAFLVLVPLAVFWLKSSWRAYILCGLAVLPWLAKNYFLTGNPVAPFLGWLFPSGPETHHQLVSYLQSVAGMMMNPKAVTPAALDLLRGSAGENLTELLPILLAAAALLPRLRGGAAGLWRFTLLFAGLWVAFSPAIRFSTPVLVPFAVLAARGYLQAEAAFGLAWPRAALGFLIAANLVRLPVAHCQLFDPARFIIGKQTAAEYVAERLYPIPYYGPAAEWINANLSADSRVLCLLDIKSHYIWRRTYHDFQYVQPGIFLHWLRDGGGEHGLLRKLRQEGVSHLLIVRQRARDVGRHYSWRGGELAEAAEFLASHTRPLTGNEEMEVLAVSPEPLPRRSIARYGWMLFMHPENLIIDGRDEEAVELLEAALAAAPWLPGARAFLGIAYARLGRLEEAERFLLPASREEGKSASQAALVLGQVGLIQGKTAAAERALRQALNLDPDLPEAHFALGMLLYEQGKQDEGRQHVSRAVKLDPKNRNWAHWYARISAQ